MSYEMSFRAKGKPRYRVFTAVVIACYGMLALLATVSHSHSYRFSQRGGLLSPSDAGIDAGVAPVAPPGTADPSSSCWLCTHSRHLSSPAQTDHESRYLDRVSPRCQVTEIAPRSPDARSGMRLRAPPLV